MVDLVPRADIVPEEAGHFLVPDQTLLNHLFIVLQPTMIDIEYQLLKLKGH